MIRKTKTLRDNMSQKHRLPVRLSDGLVPWRTRYFLQPAEIRDNSIFVASASKAFGAANLNAAQATRLPLQRVAPWSMVSSQRSLRAAGFTLAELLVTGAVLVLLVLLFTQLLNSSATITGLGHKRMDADSQAREVLDRMAIDLAQMIKRSDVDYYLKSPSNPQSGNDQLAFYTAVPGYYATVPAPPPTYTQKSPLSLVSYRINSDSTSASYNRMERMGKGLAWNGVSSGWVPIVFLPQTISGVPDWAAAVSRSLPDPGGAYEVIGPQVFRFEYCYMGTDGSLSITPPGISSMAAVIVDIAVIDSKSKVLLDNAKITSLAGRLVDYSANIVPGQLRTNWQNKLNGIIDPNSPDFDSTMPRSAISGIRLYERFFYLSPPTL
jgi:hypothetical protein